MISRCQTYDRCTEREQCLILRNKVQSTSVKQAESKNGLPTFSGNIKPKLKSGNLKMIFEIQIGNRPTKFIYDICVY